MTYNVTTYNVTTYNVMTYNVMTYHDLQCHEYHYFTFFSVPNRTVSSPKVEIPIVVHTFP